jgi:hypothetical protein
VRAERVDAGGDDLLDGLRDGEAAGPVGLAAQHVHVLLEEQRVAPGPGEHGFADGRVERPR